MDSSLVEVFFLVFCGAAISATLALYSRQPLLIAYVAMGVLLGPHALGLIGNSDEVPEMAHIGIIFLLFLLGLDMQPKALLAVLREATATALISSAVFAAAGYVLGIAFGFDRSEALVLAMAAMFSSTIIGIKLLPTTVLHHRHSGEIMIGLLLIQDFLAIFCLLILAAATDRIFDYRNLLSALLALPLLMLLAYAMVRFVISKLIARFDRFHEYIFLLAIAWCLGLSALAQHVGLSLEIGAFCAGIALATSPIAQYIALNLKPLRDFFLILFFFSIGAQLDIALLPKYWLPALAFAIAMLGLKPLVFYLLLRQQSERSSLAWDIGFRLGQISEFSILLAVLALQRNYIGEGLAVVIQTATILSFVVSSYLVVLYFPNPIAIRESLRRD